MKPERYESIKDISIWWILREIGIEFVSNVGINLISICAIYVCNK